MTDPLDTVRNLMDQAEPVDAPEGGFQDGSDNDPGMDMPPPPPPADPDEPLPPEADCVGFALNDFGNGQRFQRHFGADLMHVPRMGWFAWADTHWKRDDDMIAVRGKAHRLSDLIAKETWFLFPTAAEQFTLDSAETARDASDLIRAVPSGDRTPDQRAQLREAEKTLDASADIIKAGKTAIGRRLTHAKNAGNSNAINNFIQEAAILQSFPIEGLDAGALDVNCLSGVLRFTVIDCRDEGGGKVAQVELVPHDRAQRLTKIAPVEYDPQAICPRFTAFLERIMPAADMRRFLQRWFGLNMTALTGEQKFAFFYGSGANGKSVLIDLVSKVLGDYATSARIETLTGSNRRGGGDATPDLVPLVGARSVRTSEPDQGVLLQEGLIKELTGGEPILVRALHSDFILVYPQFKLTMSGNHKPEIRGGDDGIWRRVMLVDFPVQIPAAERIEKNLLDAMLWEERAGVFRWLVEGLLDYLESGLQVPLAVTDATQEYREDSDPFGTFLKLCCVVSGDARDRIPARDLVEAFNFWLADQGRGTFGEKTVSRRFAELAGRWKSPENARTFTRHKASTMSYTGIRLNDLFGKRFNDMPRDQQGRILRGRTDAGSSGSDTGPAGEF